MNTFLVEKFRFDETVCARRMNKPEIINDNYSSYLNYYHLIVSACFVGLSTKYPKSIAIK